jgi:hypothetical protein
MDDEATLSSVLTEVMAALQESLSVRLDLMQERFIAQMKMGTVRLLLSVAGGASLVAAWVGVQLVVGLWLTAQASLIVAAASLTGLNALVALLMLALARVSPAPGAGEPS